jgi:hypothetical protein
LSSSSSLATTMASGFLPTFSIVRRHVVSTALNLRPSTGICCTHTTQRLLRAPPAPILEGSKEYKSIKKNQTNCQVSTFWPDIDQAAASSQKLARAFLVQKRSEQNSRQQVGYASFTFSESHPFNLRSKDVRLTFLHRNK